MQLTTKSLCYMFNVCNVKHYFWLNSIDTSIVSCQEMHVSNTKVVLIKTNVHYHENKVFTFNVHYRRTYRVCEHTDDWSMSSLYAQWIAKDLSFLQADCKDWSDWAFNQADTLR